MRSLLLLALLAPSATAANWIRVSAPNLEIFTDAGDRKAQDLLKHFETLRSIFPSSIADSPIPLRVFVFSSERDFDKYRSSQSAAGNYHSDGWQDFIVLPERTALFSSAAHEYLHMVMFHSSKRLPAWMEEGVAEFYSTISVEGNRVRVGAPIAPHLSTLRNQTWLNAEDLSSASSGDGGVFYAESWALVHMLTLSPSWRDGMPKFLKALNEGTDPQAAFLTAFSVSMEDALAALPAYLRNPLSDTVPAPPAEPIDAQIERLDPPAVTLILADLALHTDHPDLARSLFLSAAKENPDSPPAIAGLGYLALSEDRKDDARRQFEQAIARGYRDAGTFFQLALLKNDNALLEKALAIDPHFADAHFLLGVRDTDQGNFAAAIDHLRQAVAVKPRQFSYWNALAYAQAKQGDRQGAAESAHRAALLATSSDQDQMAASLAQLATNKPPVTHENKPGVVIPPSWQTLKGDSRAEGTLTHVNCDATPPQLTFSQPSGPPLDLRVKDPSRVELVNAEGASTILVCGDQSRPATVEFVSATKEITRIEFTHVVIMKP